MESQNIKLLRTKYLRNVVKFRNEGRPVIYTDETYIHSSHTTTKEWSDNSGEGLKAPVSKGKRLIIVHAGGVNGFVPNALLIFKSGQKSGDYHHDMNFENYKRWMETQLIPNLPPKSVLVIDNASYHNVKLDKEPTTATKKQDMIAWLTKNQITVDSHYTKCELYDIIKQHKTKNPIYILDTILEEHGHTVLRLPPYHPEFNPIEKIWALVKNWVATHNTTFKLADVEQLARQKFDDITNIEWENICRHVNKTETEYIEKQHLLDDVMEVSFIVNTESDDDEESETFDASDVEDV